MGIISWKMLFSNPALEAARAQLANPEKAERKGIGIPSVLEKVKAAAPQKLDFGIDYYLKGALAGGICCGITHGAVCPIDVVKTRIQLQPDVYNKGMIGGFRQVIAAEGVGALATGLGPTVFGYFIQGWFKFGGVEFFKIQFVKALGEQKGWDNRNNIYLASAAMAEFIADIFLCPLEATRIKPVANPTFASSMPGAMSKIVVQGAVAEKIYNSMGKTPKDCSSGTNISVSLGSGVVAGVVAAIISHPADTLLSKINKPGAGGEGSTMTRLGRIAAETGYVKLCTQGLAARCFMIGTLTAGQFGVFDSVMNVLGASKFHFHNPADKH